MSQFAKITSSGMGFIGRVALLLILVSIGSSQNQNDAPLLVETRHGTLRGKYLTSRNGNQYETFLGVEYGHVPKRFDASEPTGPWEGVKDATNFGSDCAQTALGGPVSVTGEEDCLFLNVFTPKADNKKRPVLFFIHGGGFNYGSAREYGGAFLVDEDIVLVTLNYRLGILGFMNAHDTDVSGNNGLKDQVLALKWIQENIEHFGGDKNRVILGGQSAGSASALYLMTSPLAKGLFHGLYGLSGTPLNAWAFAETISEKITEMGKTLKCEVSTTSEVLVTCLREAPLDKLMVAQQPVNATWDLDLLSIVPSPEEENLKNLNPFMIKRPEDILREGNFPKVPVLLTMTKEEGHFFYSSILVRSEPLLRQLNDDFEQIGPIVFQYNNDPKLQFHKNEVSQKFLDFYFDGKEISVERQANLTNAYTDTLVLRGIHKTAHLLGSQTPVYVGLFNHPRNDFTPVRLLGIFDADEDEDVSHCEDLSYLFMPPTGGFETLSWMGELKRQKDIDFSKKFVKLVASFIRTGKPEPFEKSVTWPPVSKAEIESNSLNWFNIDDENFVLVNPFEKRLKFWDDLYKSDGTAQKQEL